MKFNHLDNIWNIWIYSQITCTYFMYRFYIFQWKWISFNKISHWLYYSIFFKNVYMHIERLYLWRRLSLAVLMWVTSLIYIEMAVPLLTVIIMKGSDKVKCNIPPLSWISLRQLKIKLRSLKTIWISEIQISWGKFCIVNI